MENNKKGMYFATITWVNFEDGRDYSLTIRRDTYEWILEGIQDYVKKYKPRIPQLETCAYESNDVVKDLTEKAKKELGYNV